MKPSIVVNLGLVLVAFVWGFGFIPQKLGMTYLEPAAFNAWRFLLGALSVLPVILLLRGKGKASANTHMQTSPSRSVSASTWYVSGWLGALLFGGALCQQIALLSTSVANVAFITGLYVIVVPVIGFFFGARYALIVWIGGFMAIVGLYLMTGGITGASIKGDLVALIGAVIWAVHLMMLSRHGGKHPQLHLAAMQFLFCSILSFAYAAVFESRLLPVQLMGYVWPLVNGVIVVGLAYTLQVVVMEKADPFSAAVILSLEAVFGALAGYLILGERFTMIAIFGGVLMLAGCIAAQTPSATMLAHKK